MTLWWIACAMMVCLLFGYAEGSKDAEDDEDDEE